MLTEWHTSPQVRLAALLLPVVRYDFLPDDKLAAQFGARVPQLARLTNNLIRYDGTRELRRMPPPEVIHTRMLRRLFITAFIDLDAVLMVAGYRLIAMHHLPAHTNEAERQIWAQKSLAVYVPLLEMLGLWAKRHELGNISLFLLDPKLHAEFTAHVNAYYARNVRLFDRIEYELGDQLAQKQLSNSRILMHEISESGLQRRMEVARLRSETFDPLDMNLLRIDVLVNNPDDCYLALGVIHKRWQPAHKQGSFAEGRFLDYIASPRYNGYRCLITTVLCQEPEHPERQRLVEFRIRTHQMEAVNTSGIVAAHQQPDPIPNSWWNNETLPALMRSDNNQEDSIAVFTPNGEVIYPLKPESAVLDLAFKVHSALGPYARRFYINGRETTYERQLNHLDLVSIYYDLQYPSLNEDWEDYVKTKTGKRLVRRFLHQQNRSPHRGRHLINRVLERESKIYRIRFPEEKVENTLLKIAQQHDCTTLDSFYVKVLEGDVSPDEVVASMIEAELVEHIIRTDGAPWPAERIRIARTWMQEKGDRKWARDGRVMPGAEIVGHLIGGDANPLLVVHRSDNPQAPAIAKAIPLEWRTVNSKRESAEIIITAPPRPTIVGKILSAMYTLGDDSISQGIALHRFNAEIQEGEAVINMIIDAPSLDAISLLQEALKDLQTAGEIADFNIWQLFPGQRMLLAGRLDRRQQNPYTLRQIRDRSMFFGRDEEIAHVVEDVWGGRPFIVLYGQKRIGKTSLMVHLAENVLPQSCDVLPVTFTAHSLAPFTPATFLAGLITATVEQINGKLKKLPRLRAADLEQNPYHTFATWVEQVQSRLQGTRLLFMVDEFTRAEEETRRGSLDVTFFDGLQSLIDNHGIGFLLCIHDNVYQDDSYSWGMIARGTPIHLEALDRDAALRLIRQPMERIYKFSDTIVEDILNLTDCHPYFIHALCFDIATRMRDLTTDEVSRKEVNQATAKFLQNGDHYFAHVRHAAGDTGWPILKHLAYLMEDMRDWVPSERLREKLVQESLLSKGISNRIKVDRIMTTLRRARIIEANTSSDERVFYRIPIGLFFLWMRQRTHPLVTRDMQKEDES